MRRPLTAVLLQVWQLPQNLAGIVFGWFLKGKRRYRNLPGIPEEIHVIGASNMYGGISLGNFVYCRPPIYGQMALHEYGHCRQSRPLASLGPLVASRPLRGLLLLLYRALGRPPGRGARTTSELRPVRPLPTISLARCARGRWCRGK